MSTYTQEHRRLAVETPLGTDALLLQSFSGVEELSRLFSYSLDLFSENDSIDAKQIVGKNVSFSVEFADGSPRHFNGFVNHFAYCGVGDRLSMYRAQVVPWLWFLTRTSDCRIFQNKTVPDIIKQIFSDLGFSDFKLETKGNHPQWEYCVQYRETDFNFVSRLMEQEGIYYFFQHEKGKHTLVLGDDASSYKDCKEKEPEFRGGDAAPELYNLISQWEHHHEFRSGKWAQTDYNFQTPTTSLMTNTNTVAKLDGNSKYEFYDFPGEYEKKSDGDSEVKVRMQEEEVQFDVVHGEGFCRSFSPGLKFKIKKHHSKAEEGKEYVITSVRHSASLGGSYVSGGEHTDGYSNQFTSIPSATVFRPARLTPKPTVAGVQTALTVGPKGEEIYTDKYGRIKVQFYWDREGKKDEKSSCWIRCAQAISGRKWGAMFIPRIGQEVVVQFEEGDPDRPLVVGCVYNEDQMPAYDLPAEKTKTYLKMNSTLGGEGYNEVRIEDKKGKEQIFIHAARNMDLRVKNDSMERVVGHRHLTVGSEKGPKDRRELVHQDQHLNVKRHHVSHVEGNVQLLVGKGKEAGGMMETVLEKDLKEQVGGNAHHEVKGERYEKVGGSQSLTVGQNQQEKVGMNHALDAGMEIHLKAGMKVIIEAGVQLTLKAAGGFIDIGPAGVAIQGTMVLINSGGAPGVGSGSSPVEPEVPQEAAPTKPDDADYHKTGRKSAPD